MMSATIIGMCMIYTIAANGSIGSVKEQVENIYTTPAVCSEIAKKLNADGKLIGFKYRGDKELNLTLPKDVGVSVKWSKLPFWMEIKD